MALINTYSPRKAQLGGAMFCANFKQGYASIAKQGGIAVGGTPALNGEWLAFTGAQEIKYPALDIGGHSEISFGAWIRSWSGAGYQTIVSQSDATASGFYLNTPDGWSNLNARIFINGTIRVASAAVPSKMCFLVVTWKSGNYIQFYNNGVIIGTSAATYTGAISQTVISQFLIGAIVDSQFLNAQLKNPFVIFKELDINAINSIYSNSLFR